MQILTAGGSDSRRDLQSDTLDDSGYQRVTHQERPPHIGSPGRMVVREHIQPLEFNGNKSAITA